MRGVQSIVWILIRMDVSLDTVLPAFSSMLSSGTSGTSLQYSMTRFMILSMMAICFS